jgi:pimeloyl-ACP methyl ester carboxylesterase
VKNKLAFLFFIFILSAFNHKVQAANLYFEDHFQSLDNIKWVVHQNEGNIFFNSDGINLEGSTTIPTKFPFLYSNISTIPQSGDFTIDFLIKKTDLFPYGTGIAFSTQLPQNGLLADRFLQTEQYIKEQFINFVYGSGNNGLLVVYSGDCISPFNTTCFQDINIPNPPVNQHFKIIYTDLHYQIFLNDSLLITSNNQTVSRPKNIWFGSPFFGNVLASWVPFKMKYITVYSDIASLAPIIFLPGYMGSWDFEDIKNNSWEHDWKPNPIAKIYDNFLGTLTNLGYEEGADFVRWDYNFTRPLPEISQKFNEFVNDFMSSKPVGTQAILIGHSFGGLVAKQYLKDNSSAPVKQIITVGSPHEGVLDTYPIVAAGEQDTSDIWQKMGFEVLGLIHGKNFLTKRETMQNVLPSAKDVLPIFGNYLKSTTNNDILSSFTNQNLIILKNKFNNQSMLNIIRGLGKPTKRFYILKNRTLIDTLAGDWPDGRILSTENINEGDGTVLADSSYVSGATITDLPTLSHGEIISTKFGISTVLDAAGISYSEDNILNNPVPTINQAILLLLKSPATISVTDMATGLKAGQNTISSNSIENSFWTDDGKLIFIPTKDQKKYQIDVLGSDRGEYELDIVSISESTTSSKLVFNQNTDFNQKNNYFVSYHEKSNLISNDEFLINNALDSLISSSYDIESFIATSSADFSKISQSSQILHELKSDFQLIDSRFNDKKSSSQSIEKALQTLQKSISLNLVLEEFSEFENSQFLEKYINFLRMQKNLISILNQSTGVATYQSISKSMNFSNQIINNTRQKLETSISSGNQEKFRARLFRESEEMFDLANREYDENLFGEAFASNQIARYLLFQASN